MITINAPDGSSVTFPDGTSEGTINQVMTEKFAPLPENSLAGSAKALGSGALVGTAGLLGLPADALDLATRGVDYMAGTKSNDAVSPVTKKFGSENIQKAIEGYTGELPKPQTTFEKYLHNTASFAPAMIGGPGSLLTKVGTRMIAPGVASEAAGQLAEGTGYEPAARVAGALGGAVAGSKLASAALSPRPVAVPTEVENAALKSGYQGPAVKKLEISPTYAEKVSDQAQNSLRAQRFSDKDPDVSRVYNLLSDMKTPEFRASAPEIPAQTKTVISGPGFHIADDIPAQQVSTHRMADFDNTRRQLKTIADGKGSGAEAARQAIRSIDAATLRIPTSYVVAGDARAASKELFDARKAAAVEFRDQKVKDILESAALTAQATHSGGNLENEIYKQVRTLLNPLNKSKPLRGWTAEEKDTLRAVLPDYKSGAVRRASKVLGGGGGLGQLAAGGAGAAAFGPFGMFALPAIGHGLNKLGSTMATGRLNNVSETLRARSPAYGKANQAQRQALLAGGIMKGLPEKEQLALQALIAARLQSPDYSGR